MPQLLLAVTAHGYGHLAQSAPVVAALARRVPGLAVTLQSDIAPAFARCRLPPGFRHLRQATDPGFLMDGPLVTRWAESLAATWTSRRGTTGTSSVSSAPCATSGRTW